jgi:hypothetical protein
MTTAVVRRNIDLASLRTPTRERALRHGLWVGAALALLIALTILMSTHFGLDSHAYWLAWRHDGLYTVGPNQLDAYLYSPAFAQLIWPLAQLPWPAFCTLWFAATAATYVWLLVPLDRKWRLPLLCMCSLDLVAGNIWAFFALVLVFGLSYPAAWALPLLTKITPFVGVVWFAVRREWRSFAIALAAPAAIVAASVAAAPGLWADWIDFLRHADDASDPTAVDLTPMLHPPTAVYLAVMLPIAIAITVFAARRNRPWLLPVALLFAMPFFTANAFVLLAAIPRVRLRASHPRP